MVISKLTSKAQTTIPQAVRIALGLREGDELAYDIGDGRAVLTRRQAPLPADDPFASFGEWASEADTEAFRHL